MEQQIVFLTGAGGELGAAIAYRLAACKSYRIVLSDLPNLAPQLDRLAETIEATGGLADVIVGDISDPNDVTAMARHVQETWGTLHVLINNAGMNRPKTLLRMSKQDWDRVLAVNLTGPFLVTQAFAPMMVRQKYGRIVNISALIGQAGYPGAIAYGASKSGLIGFTKCAAVELAPHNVTCNAVAPGFLETKFLDFMPTEWKASIRERVPVKRMGDVEEVANAVAFLASDESSYMTGTVLQVNGGLLS